MNTEQFLRGKAEEIRGAGGGGGGLLNLWCREMIEGVPENMFSVPKLLPRGTANSKSWMPQFVPMSFPSSRFSSAVGWRGLPVP